MVSIIQLIDSSLLLLIGKFFFLFIIYYLSYIYLIFIIFSIKYGSLMNFILSGYNFSEKELLTIASTISTTLKVNDNF